MKVHARFRQLRSMCCRSILSATILAVAFCLAAPFAGAQSTGGRVRGTVTDQSGGAVAGATVTLINEGTHATREVQSGANGEYVFLEVSVGTYEIDASSKGFKKYARKGIVLDLNEVVNVDLPLQVGGSTEVVEVTGAPPVVDTTSTQLGAVMNEIAVKQLPLNTRDTYQLLQLQPGVQSQIGSNLFYGSDQPGVVSVNGGRGRSNNYSVNGGDANDAFVNLPAIQPSPDAIEEFKVITNTFDAEFGRNSGAVVNVVTKSGTNLWHGDAFEFFRNKVLNARGFFDSVKPDSKQNQFGGTLGGPLRKDRTFIFGSYEGRRVRSGTSSDVVTDPTAAERTGDFGALTGALTNSTVATMLQERCNSALTPGGQAALAAAVAGTKTPYSSIFTASPTGSNPIPTACFDPVAFNLFNQFVVPQDPSGSGRIQTVPVARDRSDQFTIRVDHKISGSQQFSAYYYYNDRPQFQPFSFFQAAGANVPGFGDFNASRVQQWNLSHMWTIGSNSVNEFRFSYFREGQHLLDHPQRTNLVTNSCTSAAAAASCFTGTTDVAIPGVSSDPKHGITPNLGATREGVPFITVAGGFTIGNNFEGELPQVGNSFQWSDSYTKVIGKHSLKFGGDARRVRFDQMLFFEVNGFYTFGSGSPNALGGADFFPDYFLGLPASYAQGSAQGENVRASSVYLFAQDSWKIKPSLTLNYGLRWELNTPIYDKRNRVQTFRPGQVDTVFPCQIMVNGSTTTGYPVGSSCAPGTPQESVFPLGLVVPGDKGIPRGLTATYYNAFAPRIGLAWSPGARDGALAKLTGGPGKTSIRVGYGIFYNPVEQLVLEQFSAEPPFGGSSSLSNPLLQAPFVSQSGTVSPNPFNGVLNPIPNQPVDFSVFRPILLFGDFQPHLRTQYSEQYNLTIQRQLPGNILFQVGYVGSQGHRLLATRDVNPGNPQTCIDLSNLPTAAFSMSSTKGCGPFLEDSFYSFTLPAGTTFHLPYSSPTTPGSPNIPCPANPLVSAPGACTIVGAAGGTPVTLVGIRPNSSPFCDPLTGNNCPPDGTPVFGPTYSQNTLGFSNYNSLQLLLEKHFSRGLQFQGAYTFSKSIDDSSSFEEIQNPFNPRLSRSLSLFDARHRFVLSYYWELPVPAHSGFTGKLTNGWATSGIVTYQTGFPIRLGLSSSSSLVTNDQELLDGSGFDFETVGEPNFVFPFHKLDPRNGTTCAFGTGPNAGPNTPSTGPVPCAPIHAGFDPNGFALQAPGTVGNAPRTICCGPAISESDLAILKSTPITERLRAEFRAEFFNAWNHAQFFSPDGNPADGLDFGRVKRARDPREIQFALKLVF
jgi:Carboxypeptidase regulatory-like domain